MPERLSADQRGMALIGVIVLTALLLSLAIALAVQVGSDSQLRGAFGSGVTGFYAAESGLNRGMGEYRNIFLDYNVPSGADFSPRTYELGDRSVTYKLSERPGNPQSVVIPSGQVFAGLNAIQYRYVVNSAATDVNGDVEASVGAEFLVGYIPLFQFVAFYRNDLEILPGPNMVLNGRVHTNGKLYLNANNTLTIADNPAQQVFTVQVSAGQGIYRGRKDQNTCSGTVTVDMLEDKVAPFGDLDPRTLPCSGGSTRQVPVAELAAWKGSMIRDIGNIAIPEPDIIKPPSSVSSGGSGDPGVYWDKADLRIVLHLDQVGGLPGGPGGLKVIDVVNAGGAQDAVKTAALQQFMSDAAWNSGAVVGVGPSTYPGTMPIFYTDLPFAAGSGCANGTPGCGNAAAASYLPPLPAPGALGGARAGAAASGVYAELMGAALGVFDRDYRRGGFYNQRERKWMLLLNLNVRDLIRWNQQNGEPFFATNDNTEGGLVIFATVAGPASGGVNAYGVRVFGSNDIPLPGGIGISADPTGVTVASDQAMYVLGDFNRGTAAGGTPRQPASLIGDSINVLSQRYWLSQAACNNTTCRDGQSTQALGSAARNAQNTWINAAFLGGVDSTPRATRAPANTTAARELPPLPRELDRLQPDLPGLVRVARHARARQRQVVRHRRRLQHLQSAQSAVELRPRVQRRRQPAAPDAALRLRPTGAVHRGLQVGVACAAPLLRRRLKTCAYRSSTDTLFTPARQSSSPSRHRRTPARARACHALVSAERGGLVQRVHRSALGQTTMARRTSTRLRDQRGMALIGVMVLGALLMALAAALALTVRSDTQLRGAFSSSVTGFYAAESGLNAGMGEYRNIFLDYNVPHGSDFNARSLTVGNRTVTYQLSERPGNPQNVVIPSGQVFAGLNAIQYRYVVNSKATNTIGDTEAAVGAEFLVGYIPLFQFVAFYKNDLEILPGPNMTLNGRVHTNGKLYLSSSGNTLTVADNPAQQVYTVQVSSGLGVYRGRKDQNQCDGTVVVDMLEDKVSPFGDLDPRTVPCNGSATRLVPQSELAAWKGSILSNVGNIAVPEPDIIRPPSSVSNNGAGDPGVYWDKADLRIVLHVGVNGQLPYIGPNAAIVPPNNIPNMIDVLTASGAQDATKTTALRNFMMDAR
ncbi:MAG: hypothetical protein U0802_21995 [Candidatus Binatia bacterium]